MSGRERTRKSHKRKEREDPPNLAISDLISTLSYSGTVDSLEEEEEEEEAWLALKTNQQYW